MPLRRVKSITRWPHTDLASFFLRVLPSTSVKTYCIYCRHEGRASECTIGKHGQATADQARKEAKGKMGDLAKGQDIQTEKRIAHF